MEIELKLLIRPGDVARLQRSLLLQDHASAPPRVQQLVTTYFDTGDLALRNAGIAWRVRRAGRAWIQTLKGAGRAEGGLHQREEWESAIAGPKPDVAALESLLPRHHPWRAIVRDAAAPGRLVPAFVSEFRRTAWQLDFPDGTAIEVALDQGEIRGGDTTVPVSEVELELKAGDARALFEFADALIDDVPLHPSNVSKAERGYRAFRPLSAPSIPVLSLAPELSVTGVLRALVGHCLQLIQLHADGVARSHNGDSVHQMRVALRRLRAVLAMFAPVVHCPDEIRAEIVWLRNELALARDWDVLTRSTLGGAAAVSTDQAGMTLLQRQARKTADAHYRQATAAVTSVRTARCLLRLGMWLGDVSAQASTGATLAPAKFARAAIARCRTKMRKRAARARTGMIADQHRLRIAVRKTRYALEFLKPWLAPAKTTAALTALVDLQDVLGRLNDLAAGSQLLAELAAARPALAGHAGFARGCFAAESRVLSVRLRALVEHVI